MSGFSSLSSLYFSIFFQVAKGRFSYIVLRVQQGTNYQLTHDDPNASFFAQLYGELHHYIVIGGIITTVIIVVMLIISINKPFTGAKFKRIRNSEILKFWITSKRNIMLV